MGINISAFADIGSELGIALSSQKLWIAIAKTIIFILLGFIFTKKKWLPDGTGKVLTKFIMAVCLPCLAFCAFMSDFTINGARDTVVNFILGFVLYIAFIFIGKLIFIWVKDKKKRTVLATLFAFGSTTFFALPLIQSLYPASSSFAVSNFNVMNIAYRVFLYSYAYVAISSLKSGEVVVNADGTVTEAEVKKESFGSLMKKVFLNPIVIATLSGLVLWLLQAIPGVAVVRTDWLSTNVADTYVAIWRFDVTLPWVYQAANTLGGLSSTVILFAIGCTLGATNIKEAATDKFAWIWTAIKVVAAPAIVLAILFIIQAISKAIVPEGIISIDTVRSSILTWMVPPATVAVGYCIAYDQEKEMASHISLLSTFGAVFGIIIWVIVLTIIETTGFFAI